MDQTLARTLARDVWEAMADYPWVRGALRAFLDHTLHEAEADLLFRSGVSAPATPPSPPAPPTAPLRYPGPHAPSVSRIPPMTWNRPA